MNFTHIKLSFRPGAKLCDRLFLLCFKCQVGKTFYVFGKVDDEFRYNRGYVIPLMLVVFNLFVSDGVYIFKLLF